MASKQLVIEEQEAILKSKGKNLIVSASAGSGKTSVMIRKILNYIENKECHVDELLVLTYTNAAAQEMKKKLVDKLRDLVDTSPELLEELEMVQSADISTFDSFCQKLVKKYFYVLNIDPAFNILEGGDQNYEQGIALERAIKTLKSQCPENYELLLDNLSPKRDEEKIKEIILQIYNYTTSLLKIEDFIAKNHEFYNKNNKIAEKFLNNYYNNIFLDFIDVFEHIKKKCNMLDFSNYLNYSNNLIITLEQLVAQKDFTKKFNIIKENPITTPKKEKTDIDNYREVINYHKDRLKKVFEKILNDFVDAKSVEESYEKCGKLCLAIFDLLENFIYTYNKQKNKINSFDFNDIERLTIKLLEKPEICEEIKSSYKYIFVDEFQDANAVQERIIFLLEKNNLFFVGDTKQSIYAFRQSDPEIFLAIEENFSKSNNAEAKRLNCNFRTNKNILYFVNEIFNVIMTKQTADLDYKKNAQFDPKAPYEDLENEICVSLNLINKKEKDGKKAVTALYDVKQHASTNKIKSEFEDECIFICNQIAEFIGQNIYDKDLGKTRQINYKDITVLVAKRSTFLAELCQHFIELGIPYVMGANKNLEELYDNTVLYNLLKYTANTKDDYALYSILCSPLFNFSNSELAYIKSQNQQTEYFYEAFNLYNTEDDILNKINNFKQTINNFVFSLKYKGIYFALSQIVKTTNYLLTISFEEDFENRRLNIEEYINSFCQSKFDKNLGEYLIYRETTLRSQKVSTQIQSIDAIQINTMHSSKGLEYPIVILPNLDADNFKSPSGNEIKINKTFGVGVKAYNSDEREVSNGIFYECCKIKNKEIEQSEKIRLLYVAMTRAKNKLVLVGRNNANYHKFSSSYEINHASDFLNLIIGSLDENAIEKINNQAPFSTKLFKNEKLQLNVLNVEQEEIIKTEIKLPKQTDASNIKIMQEFLNIDLKEQHQDIALKNSVSEFAYDENSSINFAPKEMKSSEHLSEKASERGTIYHKILEKINFNNVNSIGDIKTFIECNFSQEEIQSLGGLNANNIYNNICSIKQFIQNNDTVLKEQKFVMNIRYNEIADTDIQDKILVQGIIDLIIIKEKNIILIDYKLSNKSGDYLKQKYDKQLNLYELALKKGFPNKQISKYILSLNKNEIIKI